MVRPRRMRRSKGLIGTSMIVQGPRRKPAQRNEHPCPVCYSVPKQPCRKVLSKTGASVLKLGGVLQTMHAQRPGARPASKTKAAGRPRPDRQDRPDATTTPRAMRTGTCPGCGRTIGVGVPIGMYGDEAMHRACARQRRGAAAILRGETFRGQRRSDWKRGRGPGSLPEVH
jgi:hypothetical protein